MIIVLDTNIFQRNFLMRSSGFVVLLDYLRKTESRVVIPKVVFEELKANYERKLNQLLVVFARSRGALAAHLLKPETRRLEISPQEVTKRYMSYVLQTLQIRDDQIFDYREGYLPDVMQRSIGRRRPCTDRGEEIRDAVLWCMLKDIAREASQEATAFISGNTKQFSTNDGNLHPDLATEVQEEGLDISFFASLEEFVKRHASRIEFITVEWLKESIDLDAVLDAVGEWIKGDAAEELNGRETDIGTFTSYANVAGGELDVSDFYVYEMRDGSYIVKANLCGEIELECEVANPVKGRERISQLWPDLLGSNLEYPTTFQSRFEVDYSYEYLYPRVELTLDSTIRDRKVVEWEIADFSVGILRSIS